LSIRFTGDEWIDVPVCQECVDQIETNQQEALDRILGPVVDSET
jgi:hypothetical protein